MDADVDTGAVIVPITDGEAILRREKREISMLVAREEVTITHARYSGGEQVAGPQVPRSARQDPSDASLACPRCSHLSSLGHLSLSRELPPVADRPV